MNYPAPSATNGAEPLFWTEHADASEALLQLQHPEGVPPAVKLDHDRLAFGRPFDTFPHDYAAVRVVTASVLDRLRRTNNPLCGISESERQATLAAWR